MSTDNPQPMTQKIISILFLTSLLAVSIFVGCGGDDVVEAEVVPDPVGFVSATPPGGDIAPNATLTLTFDNPPTDVAVSYTDASGKTHVIDTSEVSYIVSPAIAAQNPGVTVSGRVVFIKGPFPPGEISLTITWADDSITLHYIVTVPCCGSGVI